MNSICSRDSFIDEAANSWILENGSTNIDPQGFAVRKPKRQVMQLLGMRHTDEVNGFIFLEKDARRSGQEQCKL
jgi:hypothetical protein